MTLLSPVMTPAFLASIRQRSALPPNTWHFITATALSALSRRDEIPTVYADALADIRNSHEAGRVHDEQLRMTRRMREAFIKSTAVTGLPKTINSLLALKTVTPPELLDEPNTSPTGRAREMFDTPASDMLDRGLQFFGTVYGKVTRPVTGKLVHSGTEDLLLTARLVYGYILSNMAVLTPAETSFVLIAGLIPQDVPPQLKGHLKGALNNGATVEQVTAVRDLVVEICEASGMKMLDRNDPNGWGWRHEVAKL